MRTTLKELTTRAVGVVEVEVQAKHYPPLAAGQTFPRTHIDLKVLNSFKGTLPATFTLDTPGGLNGNVASVVADGPEFRVGERAIVFVKEPEPGLYMVQDLGLGKFNVVERGGKTFVESPLCSRAIAPAPVKDQDDIDAQLLTRAIPYDTFTGLVTAYAANAAPAHDAGLLAARLAPAQSHLHTAPTVPAVVEDYHAMQRETRARVALVGSLVILSFVALAVALWLRRRRAARVPVRGRNILSLLLGALVVGGLLGGTSHAFVTFDQMTIWDLDKTLNGKVANNRIIWRPSTSVSNTNPDVMTNVQASFDKWEAVNLSRLAFTKGDPSSKNANNSGDTENTVAWSATPSNDFSSSTLAICFSSFTVGAGSSFLDGDIIFNDRDFNWSATGKGNADSVSLHEIGHFIGLNHTTDKNTIMFPFDGGIEVLSSDEVAAAQALYPGPAEADPNPNPNPTPTPSASGPSAVALASPQSGKAPLNVFFDGTGSLDAPDGDPIDTVEWDFGDGTKGAGLNPTHTYSNNGTFTATLKVTDTQGRFSIDTVVITVGENASPVKASFKLNFVAFGKDSFTATLTSSQLFSIRKPKGLGSLQEGYVNIGDTPWLFTFNNESLKNIDLDGLKLSVNDKKGTVTISAKNADLVDVLGGHGAVNDDIPAALVEVPVTIWFGENTGIFITGTIPFFYKAKFDKNGSGKF